MGNPLGLQLSQLPPALPTLPSSQKMGWCLRSGAETSPKNMMFAWWGSRIESLYAGDMREPISLVGLVMVSHGIVTVKPSNGYLSNSWTTSAVNYIPGDSIVALLFWQTLGWIHFLLSWAFFEGLRWFQWIWALFRVPTHFTHGSFKLLEMSIELAHTQANCYQSWKRAL